jgi:hypothetical protein
VEKNIGADKSKKREERRHCKKDGELEKQQHKG